jgi:hypothetical protein
MSKHKPPEQASPETRKAWEDLVASAMPLIDPTQSPTCPDMAPPAPQIPVAKASDLVPIGECLGKMIECPMCGRDASVTHARGARTLTQVVSSKWWVLVKCQGYCGSRLERVALPVKVLPQSQPKPVVKTLGECVGHFVLCPNQVKHPDGSTTVCAAKSQARWDMDTGHGIICPTCGPRAYAGGTMVEVVA